MDNQRKIDPSLIFSMHLNNHELALDPESAIGYNKTDRTWRLIVKYGGDIRAVMEKYNGIAEVLTDTYAIITIDESYIFRLANEVEIEYIEKPKGLSFQLDRGLWECCIAQVNEYNAYQLKGDGVIIGIVDSGIDYSHPDFRNEDGTSRIIRMWDQSAYGIPPKGFVQGREYDNAEINEILEAYPFGGTFLPSADLSGHGTHVAGIAAGNGRSSNGAFRGAAPNASLAIVKLGLTDYDGYPIKTIDVMFAIKYLIEIAQEANMPLVINISYGSGYGSRDGNGLFETYINDMALRWKTSIAVGSGNDANKKLHTEGHITTDEQVDFIISGYTNSATLELWKSSADNYQIEIIHPNGLSTGVIPNLEQVLNYRFRNDSVMVLFSPPTPFNTNDSIQIKILAQLGYLEEGIWTIKFHKKNYLFGNYNIWMHTNVSETCFFIRPSPNNTITLPATTQNVISVAAYNYETNNIADFSGRGSITLDRIKPSIAAPGVNIMSTSPGGGYTPASGTSMASPFVAGACALMMQWGIVNQNDPYLYGNKLKAFLFEGTVQDRNIPYPNNIWGYGKLCLKNTMDHLMNIGVEASAPINDTTIHMAETPANTNDKGELEKKIRSEDYIEFLVADSARLRELAEESQDIIIGHRYEFDRYIIYVNKAVINKVIDELAVILNISYPLLFGLLASDSLSASNILAVQYHPSLSLKGEGVLIGIVDTGIDYTHPAFIDENGDSRILAIWDQTLLTGNPPENYLFGTVYTREQLNEALRSDDPFSVVPTTDTIGHGTYLAGIAGGFEPGKYLGVAPEAKFICVKLAPAKQYARENSMIFNEEAVAYQESDIIMGINFLIDTGRTFNMPLSTLLGLGTTQGSHDGLTYGNIVNRPRSFCMTSACGNEGNTMKHAMGKLEFTNDMKSLEVHVAENELGLAIYIWGFAPDKISLGLISPSGEIIERLPVKNTSQTNVTLIFYDTTIWIDYYMAVDINGDQLIVIRLKNPEPGLWTLQLYGDNIIDGRFHAWLPMRNWASSDTYFMDSSSDYTITEIANSPEVISVGAYNHENQHLFVESSKGPTRTGFIRPDLLAPGVNISGPIPGGLYGTQSSTSAAAAHVAGAAALLLEWGIVDGHQPVLNTQSIRTLFIAGANRRPGIEYPNNQYGYGELDLLNTFSNMNTIFPTKIYGFYLD